jgi:hypothetical protein
MRLAAHRSAALVIFNGRARTRSRLAGAPGPRMAGTTIPVLGWQARRVGRSGSPRPVGEGAWSR